MKQLFVLPILLATLVVPLAAQTPVEIRRDNGRVAGHHNDNGGWEETAMLAPGGPARIVALLIYYRGAVARNDTVRIVGDAAEGAIPPTSFVWGYNELTEPIVIAYDGAPGWDTIDLRDRNLRTDGFDRVVIQHRIGIDADTAVGPFFAFDNAAGNPLASFLYDPVATNSLGFPGIYYRAGGDFLVRVVVEYDFPTATGSENAPAPTLADRTLETALSFGGKPVKAARVSVADWNGDGWDDVAIGSSFFENTGDGGFRNVSDRVAIAAGATVWGDYDNDGDVDPYAVNGGTGDALYRNNGDGTFTNVMATAAIDNPRPTVTPIWLDHDRDGWLDLFIANGRTEANGQEEYFRDALWRNNGDGTFSDASESSGIGSGEPDPPYDAWGASATDFDQDGYVDIHVATYRLAPDLLFRNRRDGTFDEVAATTGVQGVPTASPEYFGHGIGTEWGDYDNDGLPDLAVGNLGHPDWRGMVSNPSLVFRNGGPPDFEFTEVHETLGIKFFEMNAGVVWLDIDNDGDLDLFHCQYAYQPAGAQGEPKRRSRLYLNSGAAGGYRFSDRTWHLGPDIHGAWTAARGDFDRDGKMDLVVASPHDGVRYYRNFVRPDGRFVAFRVRGSAADKVPTDGIGTRMTVHVGETRLYRELMGGGSGATASQNSSLMHFGLGDVDAVDSVVVHWANGRRLTIPGEAVKVGRIHDLEYPGSVTPAQTSGVRDVIDMPAAWSIAGARYGDGAFTIAIDGETPAAATIEIVDLLGRTIARAQAIPGAHQRVTLDDAVAPGLYVVRMAGGGAADSERLIVR